MEKEFVPYKLAVKLKSLGFDEECFGFYNPTVTEKVIMNNDSYGGYGLSYEHIVGAPTFSQAFRWFREEHDLFSKVYIVNFGADEYSFDVYDLFEEKKVYNNFSAGGASYCGTFDTYEEAELACLDKLIELTFKSE